MKRYQVKSPILHDGALHLAGTIELADEHAQPLLTAGVIGSDDETVAQTDGGSESDEGTATGEPTAETDGGKKKKAAKQQ